MGVSTEETEIPEALHVATVSRADEDALSPLPGMSGFKLSILESES